MEKKIFFWRNEDQNLFGECHKWMRFALIFFLFFQKKKKALARTQMFNLYCIKLAFSLKGYHLKFLSSSTDKHMKDMFHVKLYAEPL